MIISVTLGIVVITTVVSVFAMNNQEFFRKTLYSPYQVFHRKEYYRLFTHAFLHAGWIHLFVNMYVLWVFGNEAESYFGLYKAGGGSFFYFLLYLGGIIFATLPALKKHRDNFMYSSVGASGAVSAVLFACIAFNPTMPIIFIFLPIPIPAVIFGVLYLFYEAYMDKHSSDYVAHDAHYYGAIFGVLFTFVSMPAAFLNFFSQLFGYFS